MTTKYVVAILGTGQMLSTTETTVGFTRDMTEADSFDTFVEAQSHLNDVWASASPGANYNAIDRCYVQTVTA